MICNYMTKSYFLNVIAVNVKLLKWIQNNWVYLFITILIQLDIYYLYHIDMRTSLTLSYLVSLNVVKMDKVFFI